jgi:hypothetical protein
MVSLLIIIHFKLFHEYVASVCQARGWDEDGGGCFLFLYALYEIQTPPLVATNPRTPIMIPMISAVRSLLPSLLELLEGADAWLWLGAFDETLLAVEDAESGGDGSDVI